MPHSGVLSSRLVQAAAELDRPRRSGSIFVTVRKSNECIHEDAVHVFTDLDSAPPRDVQL